MTLFAAVDQQISGIEVASALGAKSQQNASRIRSIGSTSEHARLLASLTDRTQKIIVNMEDSKGEFTTDEPRRALQHVLTSMANRRFADGDVVSLLMDQSYAISDYVYPTKGWGKRTLPVLTSSNSDRARWLIGKEKGENYSKAKEFVALHPPIGSRAECEQRIGLALGHARFAHFNPKSYDLEVLEYLCSLAKDLGSTSVYCAQNTLRHALAVPPTSAAIPNALNRLVERGYLRVRSPRARASNQSKVYEIRQPALPPTTLRSSDVESTSDLHRIVRSEAHLADVFLGVQSLGRSSAVVLLQLHACDRPVSVAEIAAVELMSEKTVRDALKKLKRESLVEEASPHRWILSPTVRDLSSELDRIAVKLGTSGTALRRRRGTEAKIRARQQDESARAANWSELRAKDNDLFQRATRIRDQESRRLSQRTPVWRVHVTKYAITLLSEGVPGEEVYERTEALRFTLRLAGSRFKQRFHAEIPWTEHLSRVVEHLTSCDLDKATLALVKTLRTTVGPALYQSENSVDILGHKTSATAALYDELLVVLRIDTLFDRFIREMEDRQLSSTAETILRYAIGQDPHTALTILTPFLQASPLLADNPQAATAFSTWTDVAVAHSVTRRILIEADRRAPTPIVVDRDVECYVDSLMTGPVVGVTDSAIDELINWVAARAALMVASPANFAQQFTRARSAAALLSADGARVMMLEYLIDAAATIELKLASRDSQI